MPIRYGSLAKARWRAAPRSARTAASLTGWPVPPLHSRAVIPSKPVWRTRSPTRSPAMINSPRSPSTWLSTVSAAGTPSRPMGLRISAQIHGSALLCGSKVVPLNRLINLDYVNQYEEIRWSLLVGPRGLGRTRISPATLYAYVSRGLIRSEPSADSRSHRYRAEDVRGLKERRAPSPEPRGLKSFDADLPVMDFLDFDHHRGRPDLPRRQLHRPCRNRHARTCCDASVGRHRRRSV